MAIQLLVAGIRAVEAAVFIVSVTESYSYTHPEHLFKASFVLVVQVAIGSQVLTAKVFVVSNVPIKNPDLQATQKALFLSRLVSITTNPQFAGKASASE